MRGEYRKLIYGKNLAQLICAALLLATSTAVCQESTDAARKTTEPVFRISKLTKAESKAGPGSSAIFNPEPIAVVEPLANAPHPLDRALDMARISLQEMRSEVQDYTAILVKREQVNGVIGEKSCMNLKVRCPRETAAGSVPFSIYMKFLTPRASSGREVIWVAGRCENKLIAHEGRGIAAMKRFYLDPTGWLAMKDNRYPIYEVGLENLIVKLIEKAERDRNVGPCQVEYREGAEINKRPCHVIELTHKSKRTPYEFHKAQVFIDDELNLPIRYAAYDWPEVPGSEPKLLEEYTYVNINLNVGLSDQDFSPDNNRYKFPRK